MGSRKIRITYQPQKMENPADLLARFRPGDILKMVEGDVSLRRVMLGVLPDEEGDAVCRVLRLYLRLNVGEPEKLVLEMLRQSNPEVYSLFQGNPKARAWLKRNVQSF